MYILAPNSCVEETNLPSSRFFHIEKNRHQPNVKQNLTYPVHLFVHSSIHPIILITISVQIDPISLISIMIFYSFFLHFIYLLFVYFCLCSFFKRDFSKYNFSSWSLLACWFSVLEKKNY